MHPTHRLRPALLVGLLTLAGGLAGCVTTDYVGASYAPTAHVDVFFDEADVARPYTVMGEVRAETGTLPFSDDAGRVQKKLVEMAQKKGADAVVIGGVTVRQTGQTEHTDGETTVRRGKARTSSTTTTTTEEVKEVRALLLKYRAE